MFSSVNLLNYRKTKKKKNYALFTPTQTLTAGVSLHVPSLFTAGFHVIKSLRLIPEALVIRRHVSLSLTSQYLLQVDTTPDCVGVEACVVVAGSEEVLVVGVPATPTQ